VEIFIIRDRGTMLGYAIIRVYMWRGVLAFGTYRQFQDQTLMIHAFQCNGSGLNYVPTDNMLE